MKHISQRTLRQVYDRLNKKYFRNKLQMKVRFTDLSEEQCEGICMPDEIEIDNALKYCGIASVEIVLLHEMVHAEMLDYETHGTRFQGRIMKLFNQGAYDNLL